MSSPELMVALFRNLNLGHVGSPTGEELVNAFGGIGVARSFQTNGTILFGSETPKAAVCQAFLSLRDSGYPHIAIVRPLAEVELRKLDGRSAASVCWKPRNNAGDVTSFLEALLQVQVTTRSLGTLQRLVAAAHRVEF